MKNVYNLTHTHTRKHFIVVMCDAKRKKFVFHTNHLQLKTQINILLGIPPTDCKQPLAATRQSGWGIHNFS